MKGLRKITAGIFAATLVSAGTLAGGFLGPGGVDLIGEPFGALMVFSRVLSSIAVMGILYRLTAPRSPKPVLVPVRV